MWDQLNSETNDKSETNQININQFLISSSCEQDLLFLEKLLRL